MEQRTVNPGTRMFFGEPAEPLPEVLSRAIGQAVAEIPGIEEAYLPQCYIEGDDEARQVLFLGVQSREAIPEIMNALRGRIQAIMPPGQFLDMFPYPGSELPAESRVEACCILSPTTPRAGKSWWKLW